MNFLVLLFTMSVVAIVPALVPGLVANPNNNAVTESNSNIFPWRWCHLRAQGCRKLKRDDAEDV
ncbi:hypothetical protein BDV28DRAFT_140484 [Aspergillus coremiiformis]|uniref:Uncharacterized protein n=1 Tax=Aspergillus coremiiformis TaxID=138285 RepID=A0A5N6YWF4_9EURO|nr:hypothetical protein BDV28DRAFT_140484 [Aspergillus coremiiformis]